MEAGRSSRHTEAPMLALEERSPTPTFDTLSDFEVIAWDQRRSDHSVRGHPLEPLRAELRRRGFAAASDLGRRANGSRVEVAAIVICRQRPGTANGVVFMTLEDETGFVNVILWQKVVERFSILVRTASFLGVGGKLQVENGVVHLVADSLWNPKLSLRPVDVASRDFH